MTTCEVLQNLHVIHRNGTERERGMPSLLLSLKTKNMFREGSFDREVGGRRL